MTTTYYTFQTRKVKVSGGADLLTLVPVTQPLAQTAAPAVSADGKILTPAAFGGKLPQEEDGPRGEILDFALCRRHMETKNAWNSLRRAADDEDEEDWEDEDFADTRWAPAENREAPDSRSKARDLLELCASAAVILTALSAAAAFLSLL